MVTRSILVLLWESKAALVVPEVQLRTLNYLAICSVCIYDLVCASIDAILCNLIDV
jgi:hypothetical protein